MLLCNQQYRILHTEYNAVNKWPSSLILTLPNIFRSDFVNYKLKYSYNIIVSYIISFENINTSIGLLDLLSLEYNKKMSTLLASNYLFK